MMGLTEKNNCNADGKCDHTACGIAVVMDTIFGIIRTIKEHRHRFNSCIQDKMSN